MSQGQAMEVELRASKPLSPSVRQLELVPERPLDFVAGQWLNLHLEVGGEPLKRAYSIANAPRPDGVLELAVTRVEEGRLSPRLHTLAPGSRLRIDGPHGFFVRDEAARARPALLVGTGTGLAPLRAMIQAERGRPRAPLSLLFGCRTPADILWAEEQAAWREHGVRVDVTLSRAPAPWTGRQGYVQSHVEQVARELGEPDVYICGLSRMVKEVRAVLKKQLGYDRKRIHSERYD